MEYKNFTIKATTEMPCEIDLNDEGEPCNTEPSYCFNKMEYYATDGNTDLYNFDSIEEIKKAIDDAACKHEDGISYGLTVHTDKKIKVYLIRCDDCGALGTSLDKWDEKNKDYLTDDEFWHSGKREDYI